MQSQSKTSDKSTKISHDALSNVWDIITGNTDLDRSSKSPTLLRMLGQKVGYKYGSRRYNMMRYANGSRYCGSCEGFRTEHPEKKNRCVECGQLLRRLPRRTVHKTLYRQVMAERTEALATMTQSANQPMLMEVHEVVPPLGIWANFGAEGWYDRIK